MTYPETKKKDLRSINHQALTHTDRDTHTHTHRDLAGCVEQKKRLVH